MLVHYKVVAEQMRKTTDLISQICKLFESLTYVGMHYSFYFDIRIVGAYIRILFGIRFLP